ncbi:LacI family transcriptional regulator [Salibacterium salarium]|uniref:Catabolite control protein A n=1 Tax=Salibacterium salarium TaxID=284579 RepID=A0A3R9QLR8_9BACI|nr:LacI family DNA-binding transcriptional regulator [Salibacterium salarium]RSL33643.1 LacI family transcriptional regulator [Salibacterium salarium]
MTTIKDVSKLAGVSVATVSRVLNENGYVKEETKQKVKQSIETLEYKPNAVARSLYNKKSYTIGLIVPDIMNPFFPELARSIEDEMNVHGYTVILCNSDADAKKEEHYLDILKQKYVDGVIFVSHTLKQESIKEWGLPLVALDRPIGEDIPSVSVDNRKAARTAVEYLINKGCQSIAHICGPSFIPNANERYLGYLDAMQNTNQKNYEELIINGYYQWKEAEKSTYTLLKNNDSIDGIFAGNDIMALGVMKAAEAAGRKIPKDLQIIGFDGVQISEMLNPELTTMAQPIYEMGTKACEMLLERIEGNQVLETMSCFETRIIERSSTL